MYDVAPYFFKTLTYITTALGIIIPSIAASYFTYLRVNKNNLKQEKQKLILNYLTESFRKLALAVQRPPKDGSPYFRDLESVVADIQLFGTKSQVDTILEFLDEWKKHNQGNLNNMLDKLRNELRKELGLTAIEAGIRWFRPEGAPKEIRYFYQTNIYKINLKIPKSSYHQ